MLPIAAVCCAVALIGIGFSAWSFEDGAVGTENLGVRITQSALLGSFDLPELKHVVLDGGTGSGINPTITGVSFYKGDANNADRIDVDSDFTITFQTDKDKFPEYIAQPSDGDDAVAAAVAAADKVQFGIRINVPAELDDLIAHTSFYNEHIKTSAVVGYIDLKALAEELTDHFNDTATEQTPSNFNYDAATGLFTFKLTATTINRCFTYISTSSVNTQPTTLEKQAALKKNFAPLFTVELWQGMAG